MPALFTRRAAALCLVSLLLCSPALADDPRVSLEIGMQSGVAPDTAHRWHKMLVDCGFDGLRIRSIRSGDQPDIELLGTEQRPSYKVIGILTGSEKLILPGGTFSSRDAAGLRGYLAMLRSDGIEGVTQPRSAFGLTGKQLQAVHEALAAPCDIDTKGDSPSRVIKQLARRIAVPLEIDEDAEETLDRGEDIRDEVEGLSYGTALATVLRPYGLVLVPHKPRGGDVRLVVTAARQGIDHWPIGWPLEGKRPQELAPVLFEFLTVEIDGVTIEAAIAAIGDRLELPLLFDHNSLALHRIDLTAPAKVPAGRTYYKRILDRVLSQAKLKSELRVDEAGQPFMWITTMKR